MTASTSDLSIAKVAARIQINDVRLRYASAIVGAPSARDVHPRWVEEVRTEHEAHLILVDISPDAPVDPETDGFVVSVNFHFEYWASERNDSQEEGDLPDVGLSAEFELAYDLTSTEDLNYGDLQAFARVNSVFNAWPYWRELAHSTTRRMGLPTPLVVNVLTVNPLLAAE